jgi:phosphoserine phosphatase RsbU/P
LTHVSHGDLGVQAIISTVVQAAARLLQAEAAFCVLDVSPPVIMQYPEGRCDETLLVGYLLHVRARQTRLLQSEMSGDIRELLVVPVPVHGESMAVLGIINNTGGFKSPHIRLLEALAELTGTKVEHALLYETTLAQEKINTEMELARRVQELLLPQKQPVVNGLDVYGVTLPAFQVGGDFYDWLQSPEAFTFMVGDVAGKGVAGAMMMVMSRSALRGTAQLGFAMMTPEDILAQTCERVYDDFTQVSTFTTVFVGQYDYRHERIIYANAGHAPVIFCRAGEQARLLEADAPALGVLRGSLSENHVQPMHPGDVLVVATDGYNEAESPDGEQFGYERLLNLVELHRDKSARDLVLHLEDALREFEDEVKQHDDRTILVIKRVLPPVEGGHD